MTVMTSAIAHLLDDLPPGLREVSFPAQLELRGETGELDLPAPGYATGDREPYVLWLGPAWYLVVDRTGRAPELLSRLPEAVDVSAARTVLELSGPDARTILSHGCSLDLHPRVFGPGRCAQTRIAHVQVIVHRTAPDAYRLLPRSSQAAHLVRWLLMIFS